MEQLQQELDALQKRLQKYHLRRGCSRRPSPGLGQRAAIVDSVGGEPRPNPGCCADDIVKACNAALRQARESLNQELARLTGGGIDFSSDNNWL